MFEKIKGLFRKKALKKYAGKTHTGFMPLCDIHTAISVIDVEDTSFDSCKDAVIAFYREHDIKGEVFVLDFRKITSEERLITSITNTILKKDLSWYGKPSEEKISLLNGKNPDLFISLVSGDDFPVEFIAKSSPAKFKIGRTQLPGGTFDLVVAEPQGVSCTAEEIFTKIKEYLGVIGRETADKQ